MPDDALRYVDEKALLTTLQSLVRIPSRNPPGEEKRCAEYIASVMRDWELETHLIDEPYPGRPQVVAILRGTAGRPKLVLNGHIDVVPEGDRSQWVGDPFSGELRGGRVYGRGSSDMKGGVAAMMLAAKALKDSGMRLKGDLVLQFAMGEETGEPGTKHLLLERGFKGDWGIVLEPTRLRVGTAEKGLAWFHITVQGKPAHASRPEQGLNAISKALKVAQALEEHNERIAAKTHPLLGRAICSITMIQGGTKENVIPESCRIAVDRRFIPGETADGVQAEIEAILSDLQRQDPQIKLKLERKMVYESAEIPVASEIAEVLRRKVKEVTGIVSAPYGIVASTDVRNFIVDAGIPAVTWGPGDTDQSHTFNESMPVSQVVDAVKVLVLTAIELLQRA
jgi:succinyl-diaminopimelate desuccinylase